MKAAPAVEAAPAVKAAPAVESASAMEQAEAVEIVEAASVHQPEITPVAAEDSAAIDAPVNQQPAVISAADEAVAAKTAAEAVPAEPVKPEPAEAVSVNAVDVSVQQAAATTRVAPVEPGTEVKQQVVAVQNSPEAAAEQHSAAEEPHAPLPARDEPVDSAPLQAGLYKHHATAPMTKAPAPAYQPEPERHSDWVRPAFNFEGKGAAGAHTASHLATAPATRP